MWWHIACDALNAGRALSIQYDGHFRIVEVHAVGTTKDGSPIMRGWQVRSTKPGGDGCWRLYTLDKAWSYGLTDETSQAPRPDYKRDDPAIALVRCSL